MGAQRQQKLYGHADWRRLYDQQYNKLEQDFDSLGRMGQSSHQLDDMRYQMAAQQAHAARHQQMATGWTTGSTSSGTSSNTFTDSVAGGWGSGIADVKMSMQDAVRINSPYWEREYNTKYNETVWRLNHRRVHEEIAKLGCQTPTGPEYHRVRSDPEFFDKMFGPGAYKAYLNGPLSYEAYGAGHLKDRPKPTVRPKPKSRLVPWYVRPFVVEGGKTVARQLEKDRSDSMATAGKKFYVAHNETLLEALQRDFDIWTTGISLRAAKSGEFTIQSGIGVTFA